MKRLSKFLAISKPITHNENHASTKHKQIYTRVTLQPQKRHT